MAIQVSGTEVISNARALNNIASVDATTKASIEAAGVGGSTVKLIDNVAITTSPSALEISFSATYSRYVIYISKMRPSINYAYLKCKFRNSSNTIITGGYYQQIFANAGAYTDNYNMLSNGLGSATSGFAYALIEVYFPYQSDNKVKLLSYLGEADSSSNASSYNAFCFRLDGPQQLNALSIYWQHNTSDTGTIATWQNIGTRYSVWGIK